jgi:hypothetical protein
LSARLVSVFEQRKLRQQEGSDLQQGHRAHLLQELRRMSSRRRYRADVADEL